MKKIQGQNSKKGFTLVEAVIVIVLVGILAAVGVPLTVELVDSFDFSLYRRDLSDSGKVALARMEREIRRLRNRTSVITANAGTYRFVDVGNRTIQFALNGTNLERYDGTNIDVLANNATSLTFAYFDGNLTAIPAPLVNPSATNIKFVQINITVSLNTNTISYTTLIRLRNILQQSDLFS